MAGKKTATFQMRATPDFLVRVDEWAEKQRPPMSRATAIQTLVERQLELERQKQ